MTLDYPWLYDTVRARFDSDEALEAFLPRALTPEELRRKVRIGARAYHTHAFLRPQLRRMKGIDRFKYVSRKFLRWFGGLFLGLGMAFAAAALLVLSPWLGLAAMAAGVVGLLALMCFRRGILARLSDAILAMFATLLGVFKGMRGQTVVVWSPAKSR